jgi:hypothetical protein
MNRKLVTVPRSLETWLLPRFDRLAERATPFRDVRTASPMKLIEDLAARPGAEPLDGVLVQQERAECVQCPEISVTGLRLFVGAIGILKSPAGGLDIGQQLALQEVTKFNGIVCGAPSWRNAVGHCIEAPAQLVRMGSPETARPMAM